MKSATSYASNLLASTRSFPGYVKTVAVIQKAAFQDGQRKALEPLQDLSQEVDRRLAALRAQPQRQRS